MVFLHDLHDEFQSLIEIASRERGCPSSYGREGLLDLAWGVAMHLNRFFTDGRYWDDFFAVGGYLHGRFVGRDDLEGRSYCSQRCDDKQIVLLLVRRNY